MSDSFWGDVVLVSVAAVEMVVFHKDDFFNLILFFSGDCSVCF